jgi:hypothetical protein
LAFSSRVRRAGSGERLLDALARAGIPAHALVLEDPGDLDAEVVFACSAADPSSPHRLLGENVPVRAASPALGMGGSAGGGG